MAFNLFMHERNIYKERPDFLKIAVEYPEFRVYAVPDEKGRIHMDFNDQNALRALTKILLKKDFNLDVTIPGGFLIPTVPQRLNYLLWIEDLLDLLPKRDIPISGIDIGTGPCAIFSLLGAKKNGWNFVATETANEAIQWAVKNIKANNLESHIKVVKVSKDSILEDVLPAKGNSYDFCLCNPPFFENIEEIKRRSSRAKETLATTAKKEEILADGGEVTFVKNMIRDSLVYKDQVCLYTSMFGRKKSFLQILKELQSIKDISYTKTEFCQGNTIRWGIAWTFSDSVNLQKIEQPKAKKNKPKKAKPPLLHKIPSTDKEVSTVRKLSKWMQNSFLDLEILFKVIKSAENYAEIQITADKNTWSHQRRKRREVLKDKEDPSTKDSGKGIKSVINETQVIANKSESIVADSSALAIDSTCSQPLTVSKKRKIEDGNNLESSPAQKLKTKDHENTKSMGNSPACSQSETVSLKRNREKEDLSESSVPQKLKLDPDNYDDWVAQDFQDHCFWDQPENITIKEHDMLSEGTTSNQRNWGLQKSSEGVRIDTGLKDKQKADVIFQPKSLLFCTLKIRKGEDHLLLEMNCPPEANRESMHQIFQFLKNKHANS